MSFWSFLFRDRNHNYYALGLFVSFFLFYLVINSPYILYMEQNESELLARSPFYGVPFTLNLFNFDPSLYYGYDNASIIHPFINFLSGSLSSLSDYLSGNRFFLVIHSVINALSVVLIYYYLRKTDTINIIALLFALFFGMSSYTIYTALIPDSYIYAQFVILLSLLYLFYSRKEDRSRILPTALLAVTNFGITSTNIVPFFGALFVNMFQKRKYGFLAKFAWIVVYFLIGVASLTLLQVIIGSSWIHNWLQSLNNGGFSYTAPFSFSQHWKAIYMLVISPVLTPDITLVSPGIVAFATDLLQPYPLYVTIIGAALIIMAILGFIRSIATKEPWVLAPFLLFAFGLHIVTGYGLATFNNDLYLYAGHYLFVFFLLSARFVTSINHNLTRNLFIGIIAVFILATAANNIVKHGEALEVIQSSYSELKDTTAE
ncbi:DUF6080 domain-containing protein [Paenibacillus sp. PAMC21692]|uniref:DUF6080 domain-containing protein n=1 Tax=Paenibacillus sp. PAMC21692 TaxID=2762320 RepID=UPI00164CF688|nr:DUF6080 domain-containing protein [Paenibacillus sp. PAMC21692]QNK57600.1 hypothetical protein H7F31_01050 [Paenibacillus sp. PAMC21692]